MTERSQEERCGHELGERKAMVVTCGMCPLCQLEEVQSLKKQIEVQAKRIDDAGEENEKLKLERDLAREMLIADMTHVSCGIFEENQKKKIQKYEKALKAMWKHFGTLEDNEFMNQDCVRACKLAKEALGTEEK